MSLELRLSQYTSGILSFFEPENDSIFLTHFLSFAVVRATRNSDGSNGLFTSEASPLAIYRSSHITPG
jgi:hypothetical protein